MYQRESLAGCHWRRLTHINKKKNPFNTTDIGSVNRQQKEHSQAVVGGYQPVIWG
jgi:hypothetical protein